jgi:hypothetical protein
MPGTKEFRLTTTPICILNVPSRQDRARNIQAGLASVAISHASFIAAQPGPPLVSGATGYGAICEAIARREEFVPVLVLEDDAIPTAHFRANVTVPSDADAVYLGLSSCSISPDKDEFQLGACWKETPLLAVVRVLNMLSLHAILICSRRYAVFMAKATAYAAGKNIAWDIPVARRMHRFNVYAPRSPFFYQDGRVGGNEAATRVSLAQIKRLDFVRDEPPGWELFGAYDTI